MTMIQCFRGHAPHSSETECRECAVELAMGAAPVKRERPAPRPSDPTRESCPFCGEGYAHSDQIAGAWADHDELQARRAADRA